MTASPEPRESGRKVKLAVGFAGEGAQEGFLALSFWGGPHTPNGLKLGQEQPARSE